MMLPFIWGATAMGCLTAAGFFLRFWKQSRDRLFAAFALAFALQALNSLALAALEPLRESLHYLYLIRLLAFLVLLWGIIDKNRQS